MADKKISQLTPLSVASGSDLFVIVDTAGAGETKHITFLDVMSSPGPIGGTNPSTGEFTTLQLPTGATINEFSTDGTLIGDSDLAVPTEQAVKTYVDNAISGLTTQHNSLLGLQGGDSTASEFYHLTQAIHDGLYSGSPLIGIGSETGTNLEVDYGNDQITMDLDTQEIFLSEYDSGDDILNIYLGRTGSSNAHIHIEDDQDDPSIQIRARFGTETRLSLSVNNQRIGDSGDTNILLTQSLDTIIFEVANVTEMNLGTSGLSLKSGVPINEISNDVTLISDSTSSVSTEHAVKTYVDNAISSFSTNRIWQGDSEVLVTDTGSNGTITMDADGTEILNFTDDIQTIGGTRAGGGSPHMTIQVDNSDSGDVEVSLGSSNNYYIINDTAGGGGGGTHIMYDAGSDIFNADANNQRFGIANDTNIALSQSGNSITFEGANTTLAEFLTSTVRLYEGGDRAMQTRDTGIEIVDGAASNAVRMSIYEDGSNHIIHAHRDNVDLILTGEASGGAARTHATFTPEGGADLYYNGSIAFATQSEGIRVYGSGSPFNQFRLNWAGATSANFDIWNTVSTGPGLTRFYNQTSGDSKTLMMTLDADNGVSLMSGASVEEFSTDGTMGGDSDEAVPTEKAVKTYVDRIPNLVSEPTGFPNRTDSTITMGVGAPNRFTIAPVITSFDYYIKGVQYTVSAADSLDISEDQGLHYIYYDGGVLTESLVFDINFLKDKAYVAVTYWDSSSNIHIYLGDERHGLVMDWATHAYLHRTRGTVWSSGLPLTDIVADGTGNLNIDAQLGYSQGVIYDEDIQLTIPEMAAPANVRVFYQYGSTGTWRIKTANDFPVLEGGSTPDYAGTRLAYNEFTGGAWTLTEVVDDGYVLMHFFATNDLTQGVIAVVGQNEYTTLGDAHDAAKVELDSLILTDLPFVEFTAIATTINKTSDSFTNTPQSAIVSTDTGSDYVDWRGVQGQSRGSVAVSDHGNLTGLGNDDHIQYSLVAGSRPFIAPVSGVDPTIGSHLATKDYVDGQIAGSVSHNSTTGIQGGDPGQNEFYHIDAEFFNIASADSTGLTIAGDVRCDDLYTTGDTIHVGSGEIKSSNGNISLYYNGIRVFETFASGPNNTGGINLYSDTESTLVRLLVDDDTDGFTIYTAADGGVTRIDGENSSSTYTRMAEFNPDGAVDLYHSGVKVVQTHRIAGTNAGIDLLDDSGNTHGAIRSNSATGNFLFANTINGGEIRLLADNTGGSQVSLAFFDPDEGVELYHTNTKVLQTIDITSQWGIEIGDLASSGATAAKTQFYQGGSTLFIKNNYHNGTIQIQGEDSGGTTTTLLQLKDQNSNMYHDNLIALQMQAGGFVARSTDGSNSLSFLAGNDGSGTIRNLKDDGYIMLQVDSSNPSLGLIQTVLRGDANGSTKIYHAGSQVFETDTTGVIITGSIQLLSGTSVDEISTDTTLAGNSDDAIPTQKAVKTYVDSFVAQETTNGIEPVLQGDSTAEISFDVAQVDENYSVVGNLVNELDNAPSIYGHIIRNKTKDGFTVLFSGPMDSANYKFDWITSRSEFESSSSSSSSSSRSSSSSSSSSSSAAIPVGARATDDDDIRVTDDDEIRIID